MDRIAIVELLHYAYSHESFNAGTVWQHAKSNKDYIIDYYAESTQISRITKIIPKEKNIEFHEVEWLSAIKNKIRKESADDYKQLFELIFKSGQVKRVVFTGFSCALFKTIIPFALEHPDADFYFFQHGEIEQLVSSGIQKHGRYHVKNLKYRIGIDRCVLKDYISQIKDIVSGKRKENLKQYISYLEELAKIPNIYFYVFSTEALNRKLPVSDIVKSKFIKIFLPYVFESMQNQSRKREVTRILICSSTAEAKDGIVWKIVNYVNRNRASIKGKYEFVLGGGDTRNMDNVVMFDKIARGQNDIHLAMQYCNWLLLPYPYERYQLSCSGVLTDAIDQQIPIFMGASPCFNDFEQYEIGIRGYKIDQIGEIIIDAINGKYDDDRVRFVNNMGNLKELMNKDNNSAFSL